MSCEGVVENLPGRCDLAFVRGTDNRIEVSLTDGTRPIDITAADVKLTVVDWPGQVPAILEETNGVGEHSEPTSGKTIFVLDATTTSLASPDRDSWWQYEIRRLEGGQEFVHIEGAMIIKRGLGG